nr:hypothetical protein [Tanacetum cinerariifolium]
MSLMVLQTKRNKSLAAVTISEQPTFLNTTCNRGIQPQAVTTSESINNERNRSTLLADQHGQTCKWVIALLIVAIFFTFPYMAVCNSMQPLVCWHTSSKAKPTECTSSL